MANYTLSARLTADAKEFVKGIDQAKKEMGSLEKFSKNIGGKLQDFGKSVSGIGDSLTNKITKPAVVTTGILAGMVGTLGFRRLVGMDSAMAKLKGLGFEGKAVDTIMNDVKNSVQGTTMTMAEGVNVASGALAAGVEQGKDLEKYIKLVGSASVASGREIDEMAMIFNRVQGAGKMMTQELNMIEMGMPGFARAMADHLEVAPEKMREMVTAGEVTSQDFITVMDDFAGGMADAYAESWQGMLDNTKANIGIIGEALLEGLFEDGKEGLANFLQFLRESDGLKEWARDTGQAIRETVRDIITFVKDIKAQYESLSPEVQEIIKKTMLWGSVSLIAIGPILKIIGPIISALGFLIPIIGKVVGGFKLLAPVISLLSGPVGWIIGGIALLVGALIGLYNTSEIFRDTVNGAFNAVKDVVMSVVGAVTGFVMELWGELVEWWHENNDLIMQTTDTVWGWISTVIESVMGFIAPFIEHHWQNILVTIQTVWELIKFAVGTGMDIILGVITSVMKIINGDWKGAWNSLNEMGTKIMERASDTLKNIFNILKDFVARRFGEMKNDSIAKYEELKQGVIDRITDAKNNVVARFQDMKNDIASRAQNIVTTVKSKFNDVKNRILSPIEEAKKKISGIIDDIKGFFSGLSLTIPKPKVPKFSLSGNFSLMPPSVPKLNVSWNKDGGIFRNPTIFNTSNAGMQGVGEAGAEAILPLNRNVLGGIGKGIASTMSRETNDNREVVRAVRSLEKTLSNLAFYVNDEQLATVTNNAHDKINGTKVAMESRWDR